LKHNLYTRARRFLREVRSELKKVMWPTKKETVTFFGVVIGSVLFISGLIWVIDSVFSRGLALIIR